jgi:Tol biopolymer transport system component
VTDLYWKDIGSNEEHLLLKNSSGKAPSDWSSDGRYVVYTEINAKTGADIWALPVPLDPSQPAREPIAFANTPFMETQGQLSSDGRWMAYVSDDSGQEEVYVRPFPTGDGRWRISVAGGSAPRWRRDGKELFYIEGVIGRLRVMAVAATAGKTPADPPSFAAPVPLLEFRTVTTVPQGNSFAYAASGDGQRILLYRLATAVRPTLDLLMNWQDKIGR